MTKPQLKAIDPTTGEIFAPFFRTPHNYDRDSASQTSGLACDPADSCTQQHHAEDADINELVRRFGLGQPMPTNLQMPQHGDFSDVTDFQTALNLIRQAEAQFMTLPPDVRDRFNHDPGRLISFLENPNNREEADRMGLLAKPREKSRDGNELPLRVVIESAPGTPPANGETKQ
ncbi:MAG: internal scaffolding protein [Arizlama microvirus]|nr:MAG: internal scaffolding protein [Arizlama microvirus]